jgi:hypothetical protein
MKTLRALCTGLIMLIGGCSTAKVEDYAQNKPELDIRDYLNGDVDAWGMFVDNSGKADPMFHVTMHGEWQGNNGTLTEHFDYNDGRKQDRVWALSFTDEHHFSGTAADVVGVAQGAQFGNAVNMNYVLTVQTKSGSSYDMSMNDWLYRMDDKTVINRNEMRKFGYKVGELVIAFKKR